MSSESLPYPIANQSESEEERKRQILKRITKTLGALGLSSVIALGAETTKDRDGEQALPETPIEKVNPEQRKQDLLEQRSRYLREVLGNEYPEFIERIGATNSSELSSDLEVMGIGSSEGMLEAGQLRRILQETFPPSWIRGDVSSVKFVDEIVDLPAHYGIENGKVLAECAYGSKGSKITFFGSARFTSLHELTAVTGHEIAHANDWISDEHSTSEDRVELLERIIRRVQSEDRYRSSYVEKITNKDKQKELHLKAREYWAEISEVFYTDVSNLPIEDFEIVQGYIKKTDPDFDFHKARVERMELSGEMKVSSYGAPNS